MGNSRRGLQVREVKKMSKIFEKVLDMFRRPCYKQSYEGFNRSEAGIIRNFPFDKFPCFRSL